MEGLFEVDVTAFQRQESVPIIIGIRQFQSPVPVTGHESIWSWSPRSISNRLPASPDSNTLSWRVRVSLKILAIPHTLKNFHFTSERAFLTSCWFTSLSFCWYNPFLTFTLLMTKASGVVALDDTRPALWSLPREHGLSNTLLILPEGRIWSRTTYWLLDLKLNTHNIVPSRKVFFSKYWHKQTGFWTTSTKRLGNFEKNREP